MNSFPLVTVTTSYNNAFQLNRTLQSIKIQREPPDYSLVIDSSDSTAALLAQRLASENGHHYIWAPPEGVYPAMNLALRNVASNSFIWYLNSSDFFASPHSIFIVKRLLSKQNNPSKIWIVGGLVRYSPREMSTHSWAKNGATMAARWSRGWEGFPHPSAIVPAEWIKKLGGFDENFTIAADYKLGLELSRTLGSPTVLSEPIAVHVPDGISRQFPMSHFLQRLRARLGEATTTRFKLTLLALAMPQLLSGVSRFLSLSSKPLPGKYRLFFSRQDSHFCGRSGFDSWPECCLETLDTQPHEVD